MSKTISKDGLYVETQALRDDAGQWDAKSSSVGDALKEVSDAVSLLPAGKGNETVLYARAVLEGRYIPFGEQGRDKFASIAESLRNAANDYEYTDGEIFS